MTHRFHILALGAVAFTSACGGAKTGGQMTDRQIMEPVELSALEPAVVQQVVTGTLVISDDGEEARVNGQDLSLVPVTNDALESDTFMYLESSDGVYRGMATNLSTIAASTLGTRDGDDPFLGGAAVRFTDANIPVSGSGSYTGEHRSIISQPQGLGSDEANRITHYTLGTATLDVSFDDNTVSGAITDRSVVSQSTGAVDPLSSAADMQLRQATVSEDGLFKGGVVGGGLTLGAETLGIQDRRTFVGLIGGSEGQEIGGVTNLRHEPIYANGSTAASLWEVGVFATSADQ